MTVGELIAALAKLDQSLPVCMEDWQEQYASCPAEVRAACVVEGTDAEYCSETGPAPSGKLRGPHVVLSATT